MPTTSHLVIKIKIICISCDSQKPMIMKQAWHFHCTLLVSKLCGPLQHNMRNCRNISQTSQNLTSRYGWIQVFFYFSLVIFIWFRSQLALKWKKTDNDNSFEKNKKMMKMLDYQNEMLTFPNFSVSSRRDFPK